MTKSSAMSWLIPLDINPEGPKHVSANVAALRKRLGRG